MIFTGLVFQERAGSLVNAALWLIPFRNGQGRSWITRLQGKQHRTKDEIDAGIQPWRPCQLVVELKDTLGGKSHGFRLSGSICYDATDISLAADLKNITDAFVVTALNQDTDSFDSMSGCTSLSHVSARYPGQCWSVWRIIGESPLQGDVHRRIAHVHGHDQIAITMFKMNLQDFVDPSSPRGSGKKVKTRPARLNRR